MPSFPLLPGQAHAEPLNRSAELLNSFAQAKAPLEDDGGDTDVDEDLDEPITTHTTNPDRKEARLEAKELNRFLMAKSFFDCREFDRCAAVFLPVQGH